MPAVPVAVPIIAPVVALMLRPAGKPAALYVKEPVPAVGAGTVYSGFCEV